MENNSSNLANKGREICDNLISNNSGDYLTSKIVEEAEGIISKISSLDSDIQSVQEAVNTKRNEIALRDQEEKSEEK